jgi:DNA-binding NtrC family response regulator
MMDAVLFVDDDEDLRAVMQDILERLGVGRIVTAGSLREVEERRNEALACELAILDINLGSDQPSGVNIYEWLERERFAGRIIFLTGHAGNDPRVQKAASLAGSVIASKPLSVAELRELIGGARRAI